MHEDTPELHQDRRNVCVACGRPLSASDRGMSGKMVNRSTEIFWCIPCLSRKTGIPEKVLLEKAEYYRKMGCTLFK